MELNRVADFYVVSREMYDRIKNSSMLTGNPELFIPYDEIKKPTRATRGSAGYDFYLANSISLSPGEAIVVNTFMRCEIDEGWALMLYPKSGLGFKYHVMLANTVGVVDSDYSNTVSDNNTNEGHIMVKLVNNGDKIIKLESGSKFCQGIFTPYGICKSDDSENMNVRNGGFGSTGV